MTMRANKDVHGGMEADFEKAMAMLHEWEKNGTLKLRTQAQPMFKTTKGDPQRFVDFGVARKAEVMVDIRKLYIRALGFEHSIKGEALEISRVVFGLKTSLRNSYGNTVLKSIVKKHC